MTNKLCIYHANCLDGFGAAWVVKQALPECVFHPGVYQDPPPDVTGANVYLVDFSYKREVIVEMAKTADNIIIIDHHKTAIDDLVELPSNVTFVSSLNYSGCILTWNYFYGGRRPPKLLRYIQDRDLWKFESRKTSMVTLALSAYEQSFEVWTQLIEGKTRTLYKEGLILNRRYQKDLQALIKLTLREINICGYIVPAVNVPPIYASDAGHILAQDKAFAACYYDTAESRIFSLRSAQNGTDVSEVAKFYGGGGHKHAAGFKVGLPQDELIW